jgi:hypothetical protein
LAAAPRRWLEAGKKIEVDDAPTYFGTMNLKVESHVDQQKIVADLVLRVERPDRLQKISLRLPHPGRQPMKQVVVNGKRWDNFNPDKEVIELKPTENHYHIVAQY